MPSLRLMPAALALMSGTLGCSADPTTVAQPASPTTVPTVSSTGSSPTASALPSSQASVPATSTLPPGVDQVLTVTFRGGTVDGPKGRVKVRLGSTLRLVVTSDVAEEVHVHAYDRRVDVAAGGTAQVTFKASIPGVIEVELEKSGTTLVTLQVQ